MDDLKNYKELILQQNKLSKKVVKLDSFDKIENIAGVDVAYDKDSNQIVGALVLLDFKTLDVILEKTCVEEESFPYIPGLFSFRELPPLMRIIKQLKFKPDLIVCDGHGYAHPQRFGLASHLGVITGIPTIGCAKRRLIGEYNEPDSTRSSFSKLTENGETIGSVLRTQDNTKPVFVSIGHKISLSTSRDIILKLCKKYRLPETTRMADQLVNKLLKTLKNEF